MEEIANQPTMRMIWKAMKLFNVPITHEYIQNLTAFDLQFIEMESALDDPELRDKILNTFHDEEFDEFEKEVEEEELTEEERKLMEQIMEEHNSDNEVEDTPVDDPDDWEEID